MNDATAKRVIIAMLKQMRMHKIKRCSVLDFASTGLPYNQIERILDRMESEREIKGAKR